MNRKDITAYRMKSDNIVTCLTGIRAATIYIISYGSVTLHVNFVSPMINIV